MAFVERISSSWDVTGLVIGGMVVEGEEEEDCGVKLKLKLEAGVLIAISAISVTFGRHDAKYIRAQSFSYLVSQ
jgi:hypothetical protein